MLFFRSAGLAVVVALATLPLPAAIVGTNPPAHPLTAARIAALPAAERLPWQSYLEHSAALRAKDRALLAAELKSAGLTTALVPPEGRGANRALLRHRAEWYATAEARTMADNVASFQTPSGGWSKNFDAANQRRKTGEGFSHDNTSHFLAAGDNDRPADPRWSYIGTFDNGATTTELRFLARVATAADAATGESWRAAVRRGLAYVFASQYPNGGWPQVYPLDGGYHDAITFNDGAMINILTLLRDAAAAEKDFAWLTADERARCAAAVERGIDCILRCQIVAGGRRTVWCQQHDMLTLTPTSARNYEMPSASSGESAGITLFLMATPQPSAAIVAAVHAAAAWFEKTAERDIAFTAAADGSGRTVIPTPGKGPLWPRYAETGTDRPLFGDRDKTIHDRLDEISAERRDGYMRYTDEPLHVLKAYAKWARSHPLPVPRP